MSAAPQRFPFARLGPFAGASGLVPVVPFTLSFRGTSLQQQGLVDSGASVCVLPLSLGLQLGCDWAAQPALGRLAGNLAAVETKELRLDLGLGTYDPVAIMFAWAATDAVPVILGRISFFIEFDISFSLSRGFIDIARVQGP